MKTNLLKVSSHMAWRYSFSGGDIMVRESSETMSIRIIGRMVTFSKDEYIAFLKAELTRMESSQ